MGMPSKSISVAECKIQASILLKSLNSENVELSQKAAKRFLIVPEFKNFSGIFAFIFIVKRSKAKSSFENVA